MHVNARIHHPATAELFFVTRLGLPAPGPLPSFGSRASALRTLMQRQPQRQLLSTTHRRITRFRGQPPAKTDRHLPARRTTHDACCSWLPCPPVVPTLDAGILGTKRAKRQSSELVIGRHRGQSRLDRPLWRHDSRNLRFGIIDRRLLVGHFDERTDERAFSAPTSVTGKIVIQQSKLSLPVLDSEFLFQRKVDIAEAICTSIGTSWLICISHGQTTLNGNGLAWGIARKATTATSPQPC